MYMGLKWFKPKTLTKTERFKSYGRPVIGFRLGKDVVHFRRDNDVWVQYILKPDGSLS